MVANEGSRLENFMAVQLQRAVASWNERGKGPYQLFYVRTKDGHEVDFAIADHKKIYSLIEVKMGETNISPQLIYLKEKLNVPLAVQVVKKYGFAQMKAKDVFVLGVDRFLNLLP